MDVLREDLVKRTSRKGASGGGAGAGLERQGQQPPGRLEGERGRGENSADSPPVHFSRSVPGPPHHSFSGTIASATVSHSALRIQWLLCKLSAH